MPVFNNFVFNQSTHSSHLETYNRDNLHICKQCDFAFSDPFTLKRHSQTHSGEAFANTQWRKDKQMHPVQVCIVLNRKLEDAHENTHWGKAKHTTNKTMSSPIQVFEDSFEKTQ